MKVFFQKAKKVWKLISFLLLVVITFVYAMFQGGFVSWFLFISFLPFALYAFLVMIYPLQDFEVTRTINQEKYRAGDRLVGTITLRRTVPVPLAFLLVEEVLPNNLLFCQQTKQAKRILFPWFKSTVTIQYALDRLPRGEHTLTGIRLVTGDFLGLVEKERVIELDRHFLVYPNYVEMTYRQHENKFDQGSTSSRMKMVRDTSMTVGVREYQPGDRFSWIDWKASARRNDIMTKEFEQQQSHDVMLFLDRSQSASFESVVSYSAALTKAILKYGSQVGLVSVGEDRSIFSLRSGEEQFAGIYYHLAKIQPNCKRDFSKVIEMEIGKFQPTVTFVFLTGKLTKGMAESLEKLSSRHLHLEVHLTKDVGVRVTKEELACMDLLKRRNIFVKTIYPSKPAADVISEVS
ncbi:DUF58 domain-containing protein [Sutcliffiella horikoshii]|uniref:DUF58 domain-containing protein n=1 Tax=Sutcliffiella horikoshii TaxID=79883 RepID=UPI001F16D2A5|nr:DUF58 domain-containing protein [Sutcliffiella horikoshii]MCG1024058.1 DUF58 domain-containing protein [Sutcliffiella horikoshii]